MAATQVEIARRVGLDVSTVNKILNRRQGPVFKKTTIQKVFKVAKKLGYSLERLKHSHGRAHERRPAGFPADMTICNAADGKTVDHGTCEIGDIALCGASLEDVKLQKGVLPIRPFVVRLRMKGKRGGEVEVMGHVVRLRHSAESLRLGLAFQGVGPELEGRISSLTR